MSSGCGRVWDGYARECGSVDVSGVVVSFFLLGLNGECGGGEGEGKSEHFCTCIHTYTYLIHDEYSIYVYVRRMRRVQCTYYVITIIGSEKT